MKSEKDIIIKPVKNSGLIVEAPRPEDWVFGGVSGATGPVIFPDGHGWFKFRPTSENQRNRNFDSFSCVTFSCLKSLSYYIKACYGLDMDFSERFTAVMSGTVPGRGNSIRNVLESIRKQGFVLESDYPSMTDSMTEAQWFAYPPKSVRDKALKNLERWKIEWEVLYTGNPVPHTQIIEAQKKAVPIITVFAWASYYGEGVYLDYNYPANHATTSPEHEDNDPQVDVVVDDSYQQDFGDDAGTNEEYLKRLAKTFKIHSAHIITAQPKQITLPLLTKLKIMLINFFRQANGAFWFILNGKKQKFDLGNPEECIGGGLTLLDRNFGSKPISDIDLAKYGDFKFFG
jgi:hypothetical protein